MCPSCLPRFAEYACKYCIQATASYISGSLSIISSLVDSAVDITSGLVIYVTSRAIKKRDPYLYPRGRTRLEPLALIIVSVVMGVASVQLIIQSIHAVVSDLVSPNSCRSLSTTDLRTAVPFVRIICQRSSSRIAIQLIDWSVEFAVKESYRLIRK